MKKHIRHRILILTDTLLEEILCFFACTKDNEKNKWVKFPNLKVPVYFAVTGQIPYKIQKKNGYRYPVA